MLEEIQIGKQYRLNIRPNADYLTPCCGIDIGEAWLRDEPQAQGVTVTVVSSPTGYMKCVCGERNPVREGLFAIRTSWGGTATAPAEWLEKLDDGNSN